jgi:hypothetical protein
MANSGNRDFLACFTSASVSVFKDRPLRQIVQVHVLREYSLGGLCRRACEVGG